jgi:aryl-alcohol dehydrogenase-like predicted oxidoreductase
VVTFLGVTKAGQAHENVGAMKFKLLGDGVAQVDEFRRGIQ